MLNMLIKSRVDELELLSTVTQRWWDDLIAFARPCFGLFVNCFFFLNDEIKTRKIFFLFDAVIALESPWKIPKKQKIWLIISKLITESHVRSFSLNCVLDSRKPFVRLIKLFPTFNKNNFRATAAQSDAISNAFPWDTFVRNSPSEPVFFFFFFLIEIFFGLFLF